MERAHAGLIIAKAETLFWGDAEHSNRHIPNGFWQPENHDDFNQDWENGDFSRWVDGSVEVRAFGVSFDFVALSELVPAQDQASSMRLISVAADPEWISAHDLRELLLTKCSGAKVERAMVEACQLGQIAGRAARMTCDANDTPRGMSDPSVHAASMEWDIPLWFWRDFVRPDHFQDWYLNKAHGDGRRQKRELKIELQGVHFHRSGLANLGLEAPSAESLTEQKRGRRPTYDWPAASLAIFGLINRGDFKPENQADVERALIRHLSEGDNEPSESAVRPYAKLIWSESQKA